MCRHRGQRKPGFSLVELMVVVVIIGVMSTIVTIQVTDYLVTAKQNVAKSEIATIKNALELYYMQYDRYPTTDEGLAILTKKTSERPNGIITNDLRDPWGNEYVYVYPSARGPFEILCVGADGKEGGVGADADISSAETEGNPRP